MRIPRLAIGAYHGDRGRDLAAPRRRRRSRRQVGLRVAALVLTLGLVVGGGYWLLTASMFEIARVESGPYRYSSEVGVEAAFSLVLGRNIWRLTRADAEQACAGLPWVREIHVRRRLPNILKMDLVEWPPLLAVASVEAVGGTGMLLADGRVLAAPEHLDVPGLPILVGCELVEGPDAQLRLADAELVPLLELVEALQDTGLEVAYPVDFVRRTPDGFVLELQGRVASLQVGHGDFASRLRRYLLTREQVPTGAAVDLRFQDRITIEPAEPGQT